MKEIKRGDIYYCDLSPTKGSEQNGQRPVLVIQNDKGNLHSPTVIVAAFTTKTKKNLPTHVEVKSVYKLKDMSLLLLEQIRTVDKKRLSTFVGSVNQGELKQIEKAVNISLGLVYYDERNVYGK